MKKFNVQYLLPTLLACFGLVQNANAQTNVVSDAVELQVLKNIYDSLGGINWTNKTNWPTPANWPASATAAQMGTWAGITASNGDITSINLTSNNLVGIIPNTVGNLTLLKTLSLQNSYLAGIPKALGRLTNLITLQLVNAHMSGAIPPELNNMTSLVVLSLDNNTLTGTIPNLGSLVAMQNFTMGSNPGLTGGPIPSWIGNFPNLWGLGLSGTNRTGSIPSFIFGLNKLTTLNLGSNSLTGLIPSALANLTKLTVLNVSFNQLTGPLPNNFSGLTLLNGLYINDNQFSGDLPSSMSSLVAMNIIYMQNNKFTGPLPDVTLWTNLYNFAADNNKFSGPLHSSYSTTNLPGLHGFFIGNNLLTGAFPNIDKWTTLAYLRINNNFFSGPFPSVTNCPGLGLITAGNNQFTSMPTGVLKLTNAYSIDFSNNLITQIPNLASENAASLLHTVATSNYNFSQNYLDFAALEILKDLPANSMYLTPQKAINDASTQSLSVGSDFLLTARPRGTFTSNIKWEKLSGSTSWQDISASNANAITSNTYKIAAAPVSAEGTYRWSCTSTKVTGMTLSSIPIEVKTPERFNLDNLGFQYKYDSRKRMIAKRVPGADWVYMVYDDRDRLILTQDGNQRSAATQYWSFTKYDFLNRPIQTGIKDTSVVLSQTQMQGVVDAHFAKTASKWSETYVGSAAGNVHGYSNKSYPVRTGSVSTEIDPNKYLSVTYYDDYSFKSIIYDSASYSYVTSDLPGEQATNYFRRLNGLVTGTKIKVLDGGITGGYTWLKSVNYYDDRNRTIQTIVDNYKGGTDRTTSVFDFVGKVLKTKTTEVEKDVTWKDLVGVTLTGNKLLGNANGWGASGAASYQQLAAGQNGWLELTSSELTTNRMVGFSDVNVDAHMNTIDYAIYQSTTVFQIYENGVFKANIPGALTSGEVLRVERSGTTILYKRNGLLVYTSATPSSSLLMADAAIYGPGQSVVGVRTSFGNTTHSITRRLTYDHAGRLLKTFHTLDGGTEILLAQNTYNELGQLVDKTLHSTDNGATSKQSTDYRYNIRGWLTSVNNSKLTNDGVTNDDTNDLFGMELGYNNDIGTTNTPLFNGNISAMKWSRNLALGAVKDVAYNYSYDPMNRLLSAAYKKDTLSAWSNTKDVFSESGYSYDLNGNIMGLTRKNSNGGAMDVLTYSYGSGNTFSNRLLQVGDTGDKAKGFIEPVTTVGNDYNYDVNGNMISDQNKGITAIAYNHLNLPVQVTKSTNEYIKYIYDAGGRKLNQGVYNSANLMQKSTDYDGEFFYENDTLKFINHEEGRIVMKPTPGEYQYHLKDHLGNVRTTFTTLASSDVSTATLEPANATTEQSKFLRYSSAETVYATLFDHTNGASPGYSERLNGSTNEKYGLAKSLSVMPGDILQLEVYAKYVDTNPANWTAALTTLMGQITANTGGIVIDGMNFATSTATFPLGYPGLVARDNNGAPKAYLNWLIFNRDFGFVTGGFKQITTAAKETGTDGPHERVAPASDITITEPGYVYVWLSNEETTPVEVYFDDFKVSHIKSPVIQTDDYYPFGLRFNSYTRENALSNKRKLFQGQEHIDDLGLNWDSFKWRNHQPDIGRFFNVDPLAAKYYYNSPYAFSENKVTAHIELEGLESVSIAALNQELAKVEGAVNQMVDNTKSTINTAANAVASIFTPENVEGVQKSAAIVEQVSKGPASSTGNVLGKAADVVEVGQKFADPKATTPEKVGIALEKVVTNTASAVAGSGFGTAVGAIIKDGQNPNGTTRPGNLVNSYRVSLFQGGAAYGARIRAINQAAAANTNTNTANSNNQTNPEPKKASNTSGLE